MVFAPMDETVGGTYVVKLVDKSTGSTLRSATIKLNSKEKTRSLRGLPVSMNWDTFESYSDIVIDGELLMRMYMPSNAP